MTAETPSLEPANPVDVTVTDEIMIITINRPEVRNAVNRGVSEGIASALDRFDDEDGLRVAVLTGAGGNFCAGMDLKAFPLEGMPAGGDRGFAGITARPPEKPIIAAVEGFALAGGFEIALATDLIVASRAAQFGIPEVQRGLMAAAGGLVRLGLALPYQSAMWLALTGARVGADELHRAGLVTRVSEPGEALNAAIELAHVIARNAPLAIQASKKVLRAASGWTESSAYAIQQALLPTILGSADAIEGARSFTDKRTPHWTGR
jgi:enoyl-CoA hydratase